MTDNYLTELTAVTTPDDSDLLLTTTNVSTTPTSKKVTWTVVKAFLKTATDLLYAPIAKGVTNGDTHDHSGGDGAQINHTTLSNIGTNSHATIDTHLASTSNPHSTTAAQVAAVPNDGWVNPSETWTRTGNQTFTISGDKTAIYKVGLKIKWTQTSVKYGVVLSSSYSAPNTTVTIATNTDYVLTAAAISNNYWSREAAPEGFPSTFSYTPTWTNLTVGNGTQTAYYRISETGEVSCMVHLVWGSTTSISGAVSFTPPVPVKYSAQDYVPIGGMGLVDTGTALYMGEAVYRYSTGNIEIRVINAAGTYAVWSAISSTVPHTWESTDIISTLLVYHA